MQNINGIFASDFDGTILFRDRDPQISKGIEIKADAFRKLGGVFGYCSGRPAGAIEGFEKDAPRADFTIASSGALIVDKNHTIIFSRSIRPETAAELVREGQTRGYATSIHAGEEFILVRGVPFEKGIHPRMIDSVEEVSGTDIHDVSIMTNSAQEAEELTAYINTHYGKEVTAFTNREAIDIAPAGCSKGNGLDIVCEYFNCKRSFGIGDSYNDVPLIRAAETGFTFLSSPEAVRNEADHLVNDVEEALLFAIDRLSSIQ